MERYGNGYIEEENNQRLTYINRAMRYNGHFQIRNSKKESRCIAGRNSKRPFLMEDFFGFQAWDFGFNEIYPTRINSNCHF